MLLNEIIFKKREYFVFPQRLIYFVKSNLVLSENVAFTKFCQKYVNNNLHHKVWNRKNSLTLFSQKFRESNRFTKEIIHYIVDLTNFF